MFKRLWCNYQNYPGKQKRRPIGAAFCLGYEEGSDLFLISRQTWQRPTLPRLETKYHRRWGVSRPSSEWDRVQPPRHSHQVSGEMSFDFWFSFGFRMPGAFSRHVMSIA